MVLEIAQQAERERKVVKALMSEETEWEGDSRPFILIRPPAFNEVASVHRSRASLRSNVNLPIANHNDPFGRSKA